jgi:hypothetical protein
MNYCGFGSCSYFRKVLVPVPIPVPDLHLIRTAFQLKNCFPESWHLILDFLNFVFHFILDPGPNLVPEPEFVTVGFGSTKAKSCCSCGSGSDSGSTTLVYTLRLVDPSKHGPEQNLPRYIRYQLNGMLLKEQS